jgi:hypothetical protein
MTPSQVPQTPWPLPPHLNCQRSISLRRLFKAYKRPERIILPDDEDDGIRERLDSVWISVRRALSQRPELKWAIANEEESKSMSRYQVSPLGSCFVCAYNLTLNRPPDVAPRSRLTLVEEGQVAVASKLHVFIYSLLAVTHKHLPLVAVESERHGDYSIICPFHRSQRYCRYPGAIYPL